MRSFKSSCQEGKNQLQLKSNLSMKGKSLDLLPKWYLFWHALDLVKNQLHVAGVINPAVCRHFGLAEAMFSVWSFRQSKSVQVLLGSVGLVVHLLYTIAFSSEIRRNVGFVQVSKAWTNV